MDYLLLYIVQKTVQKIFQLLPRTGGNPPCRNRKAGSEMSEHNHQEGSQTAQKGGGEVEWHTVSRLGCRNNTPVS